MHLQRHPQSSLDHLRHQQHDVGDVSQCFLLELLQLSLLLLMLLRLQQELLFSGLLALGQQVPQLEFFLQQELL